MRRACDQVHFDRLDYICVSLIYYSFTVWVTMYSEYAWYRGPYTTAYTVFHSPPGCVCNMKGATDWFPLMLMCLEFRRSFVLYQMGKLLWWRKQFGDSWDPICFFSQGLPSKTKNLVSIRLFESVPRNKSSSSLPRCVPFTLPPIIMEVKNGSLQ